MPELSAPSNVDSVQALSKGELEARMRWMTLGLLGFDNGGLEKFIKDKAVAMAMEGSRMFRAPADLGEMLYEGCLIVVFGGAAKIDADAFFKNAARSAKRIDSVEGSNVAVFEEMSEDDVWTTLVAFPRRNILLVATDLEYLRTVLARMHGATGARALPETLPEWKYVNKNAPVWGVRHYERRQAELDPSSPFEQEAESDNSAVGVAFWLAPVSQRMATVNYLSGNANARQILQDRLGLEDSATASPREFQVRLRQPAIGVIEGAIPLSETEAFYHLLLGLDAMIGHGVYF